MMTYIRFPLVLRRVIQRPFYGALLDVSEVARASGIHPELIERFVSLGLLEVEEEIPEPLFDASVVLRIRRMVRLRHDLGVNWAGVGVIMDLLEKIEELEKELERLKSFKI